MELTLWDSSFDQATPEESNAVIHGLKHDFYFRCGLDVIEESALNEKCCVQVLRKLITKADNEIVELEEELVILQSQLAWADEEWSQLCTIALREKIDCLDISIRSLKNETLQHEYDFGYCLQMHREPADRLHDILKALLSNFSHQKDKQSTDIICQESSAERSAQATKLLVEKKQTRNPASNTIRNLQVKEFIITSAEKHVISKKLLKSPGKKTIYSESAKLANTLSNVDKQRSIKVEAIEHTLTPADLPMTQKSSVLTLMKQRNHLEPLKYEPLAIVFPHSSSNGEKLAIGHSKEIIPRNSNSVITIRKPTNKSSTTSAPFLTLSSKHEKRTCVEDKQKSSTGCNGKKKLSNIGSRIINEKVGAQSSTEKSIILVSSLEPRGNGKNNSIIVKPTDTTSDSRSDSSKEATGPKLIEGPDAAPNSIDTSNSVSKEDMKITSTRRVKAQETTASGTTPTATESLLELLYNRQENTKIPRSRRNVRIQLPNEVQKAEEPGRNSDPMSQKRRKICSNSPVLEGTKALAILHDDEANSMAENVKALHCPTLLDDLTVVELRVIAKQRGMTGYSKLRKADLARELGMKLNHRGLRKGNGNGTNVLRIMPGEP